MGPSTAGIHPVERQQVVASTKPGAASALWQGLRRVRSRREACSPQALGMLAEARFRYRHQRLPKMRRSNESAPSCADTRRGLHVFYTHVFVDLIRSRKTDKAAASRHSSSAFRSVVHSIPKTSHKSRIVCLMPCLILSSRACLSPSSKPLL
jgi:hypothetical protein